MTAVHSALPVSKCAGILPSRSDAFGQAYKQMTNQPDIVQPRVRRTGKSGNAPAALAEQSTRVLIRVPRLPGSATQPPPTQGQAIQPQPIPQPPLRPQPIPPQASPSLSAALQQTPADRKTAPAAGDRTHYTTTAELLRGSQLSERPAAPASPTASPSAASRQTTRIDGAHNAAAIGPHSAAPDWLDDRSGKNVAQTRLLLVVGAIAGFALGALTWHGRGNHSTAPQNSASRTHPAQASPDRARAAASVTDTAAAEFNLPAQIAHGAPGPASSNESAGSTWQWNPKGAANEPATIGQPKNSTSDVESANAPTGAGSSDAQSNDPSRAAWLQGTIDTVHSPSAPVQR